MPHIAYATQLHITIQV